MVRYHENGRPLSLLSSPLLNKLVWANKLTFERKRWLVRGEVTGLAFPIRLFAYRNSYATPLSL
jgi:hypothetical protein